ncbi:Hsp20/alpha crystallin family protein [Streptomyces hygroscopicus]|uniref:Hsp20/alpha crystallin family protein n=1 Tax=Streptomyces hygroscopicus TaxID=1912 RepID=UPI000A666326|nr:Hsp20/alpha crystallin family protein [Streptomyces hygroscopicus]
MLRHGTRRTGRFGYRALLPVDVKADEITATLADGVLTATVPRAGGQATAYRGHLSLSRRGCTACRRTPASIHL